MKKKLWNKDFILLLQGSTVSIIGDLMYSVAIGYWVYQKTGSTALMGTMSSISMFVTMFLSPFSGSIVDKCNRKWVLVGIDTAQGLLMIAIGILAYLNKLNIAGVLITAFLAALGSVFFSPAVSTLMIDIIPHDDMVRGQSVFSGISSAISMLGTAFSGVMVAFFGVPLIVVINGLSNLYSAVSELFIRIPKTVQQGDPVTVKGVLRDTGTAVSEIFKNRFMQVFVPCALLINFLGAGASALMLPFCMEKGFSVDIYGYLMSAYTAASLLCALILGIVKLSSKARYLIMGIGFCLSVPCSVLACLAGNPIVVGIALFLSAFLNSAGNSIFNASMMLALPEENRGAILGFIQAACTGGIALSSLIYGLLGEVFPLYLVFMVGTIASLPLMLYLCLHKHTKEFILEYS